MKVLFVHIGVESLGVEYLAAAARKSGHDVSFAFDPDVFGGQLMWEFPFLAKKMNLRKQIVRAAREINPDVAAFSCASANYRWSLETAAAIKESCPGVRTVFGGVHVTVIPEKVIQEPSVDSLIVSEADKTFPDFLNSFESGGWPDMPGDGVWIKNNGAIMRGAAPAHVENLDEIPFPAKDIYYDKIPVLEESYSIVTSRGCPYRCTYCHNSFIEKVSPGAARVRRRSVDNVIEELTITKKRGNSKIIKIMDDVFTINEEWLNDFAEKYSRNIGMPFYCLAHPNTLGKDVIATLKKGGCKYVAVGIQSADNIQRKTILKRTYENEDVKRGITDLKAAGISVFLDHIVGIPGDTMEIMHSAAKFYNELKPDRLLSYWLTYFPGTQIIETALEMGVITPEDKENIEAGLGGALYGSKGVVRPDSLKKYIILYSMVPLLPRGLVNFIVDKKLYKYIPSSYTISNMAIALNAIRKKDFFFIHNLKYLFSKKMVP